MTTHKQWNPPQGMTAFVAILQRLKPEDAAELLRLAFDSASAHGVMVDFRLRNAAPALLEACKAALDASVLGERIEWTRLATAIDAAERDERRAGA